MSAPKRKPGRPKSKVPLTRFFGRVETKHAEKFYERKRRTGKTVREVFGEMVDGDA